MWCLALQIADDPEDLLNEQGRQAHARLVQKQQARRSHQRTAQGQHLLLAAREQSRCWARRSRRRGKREVPGRASARTPPPPAPEARRDAGSHRRSSRRRPDGLPNLPDAELGDAVAAAGDVGAVEPDRSGRGLSRPDRPRMVVVLPAPLAPIRQTTPPAGTDRSMPLTAAMSAHSPDAGRRFQAGGLMRRAPSPDGRQPWCRDRLRSRRDCREPRAGHPRRSCGRS